MGGQTPLQVVKMKFMTRSLSGARSRARFTGWPSWSISVDVGDGQFACQDFDFRRLRIDSRFFSRRLRLAATRLGFDINIDIGLSDSTRRGIVTALNGDQRKGQNNNGHPFIDVIGVFHLDQEPPRPGTDCC